MSSDVDRDSKNDRKFLAELIKEFGPMIAWTAKTRANYDDAAAEEILQDTMVRLVKNVSKLEGMDRRAQYVYVEQTIKHVASNYFHRKHLEQHLFEQKQEFEKKTRTIMDNAPLPENAVEHKLYVESRLQAFRKLTKFEQQIMLQKYFLGISDQELAKQLGCKPASVRMVLTRIRKKARSYIDEKERENE